MQDLLSRIGSGLDEFLKFEHNDAYSRQDDRKASLAKALPEYGVGIDEVTRELLELVVPNGSAVTRPGFTGYVTTRGHERVDAGVYRRQYRIAADG